MSRQTRAWTRRQTLRMIARCTELTSVEHATEDVSSFLAYDEAVTEDARAGRHCGRRARWRGLILRNYSVGAWRDLWAWLVNRASTGSPPAASWATGSPMRCRRSQSAAFSGRSSRDSHWPGGQPAPAELDPGLAESDWPVWSLSILLLGARRSA